MLNGTLSRARDRAAGGAAAVVVASGVAVGLTEAGTSTPLTGLAMAATLGVGLAAVVYGARPARAKP